MNKSCLITNSGINKNTGGGVVSLNLLKALQQCTDVNFIFSTQKGEFEGVKSHSIDPGDYNYNADPFSMDYLAYHLLPTDSVDIVQTYGCPFGLTVEELKRNGAKVVADVAPHNLELSQEEHLHHCGQYPYPHLVEPMLWGLYSRNLRDSDIVIVHSKVSASYIQAKARLKDLPTVIPHGCYLPDNIPEYPEKFIPGYFGSLGADKGTYYLFRAWLPIGERDGSQLYLGGYDCTTFEKDGMFFLGSSPLPLEYKKHFNVVGGVENPDDFYKQISIYIQPSITEGFAITPLEAMANGRPVIVSDQTGVADLITDGKEGFVIPIRNTEAIQGRILYFKDNPSEIQRMGAEARKTAEKYTWDIIQQRYVEVYKKL